ncbi:MAG: hypothetical protein JST80_00920 [Bdellovibrionales bacterium]|nr:hypothetical protein [Bdellovibrionales bacterium]
MKNKCELKIHDSGCSVDMNIIMPNKHQDRYSYRHCTRDGTSGEMIAAANAEKAMFQRVGVCE